MTDTKARLKVTHMIDGAVFYIDIDMKEESGFSVDMPVGIDALLWEQWTFARVDGGLGGYVRLEYNLGLDAYYNESGDISGDEYCEDDDEWEEYKDESNYFVIECLVEGE